MVFDGFKYSGWIGVASAPLGRMILALFPGCVDSLKIRSGAAELALKLAVFVTL